MFNNFENIVLISLMYISVFNYAKTEAEIYYIKLSAYNKFYINFLNNNIRIFVIQTLSTISKSFLLFTGFCLILEIYSIIFNDRLFELFTYSYYLSKLIQNNFMYEYMIQYSYLDILENVFFIDIYKTAYNDFLLYFGFLFIIIFAVLIFMKNPNFGFLVYKNTNYFQLIGLILLIIFNIGYFKTFSLLYLYYVSNNINNFFLLITMGFISTNIIHIYLNYFCLLLYFISSYLYIKRGK